MTWELMTRTSPTTLAVAADYADAMLTARRVKNFLVVLILATLLLQLTIFFLARYAGVQIRPSGTGADKPRVAACLEFFIDLSDYLGVILPIVLAVILFLLCTIMLVGRLVGVSQVISAFCWCVVLAVLMFPLQALLNSGVVRASGETYGSATTVPSANIAVVPDVRIPGALYTWPELARDYDFHTQPAEEGQPERSIGYLFLKWLRYVVYPLAMVLVLLTIHVRSRRGLRFALGESEVPEPVSPVAT
jgi:hypothetical protein